MVPGVGNRRGETREKRACLAEDSLIALTLEEIEDVIGQGRVEVIWDGEFTFAQADGAELWGRFDLGDGRVVADDEEGFASFDTGERCEGVLLKLFDGDADHVGIIAYPGRGGTRGSVISEPEGLRRGNRLRPNVGRMPMPLYREASQMRRTSS